MIATSRDALKLAQTPPAGQLRLVPESTVVHGVYAGTQFLGTVEAEGHRWVWSCADCLATSGYRWATPRNAASLLAVHQARHDAAAA